ncbi:hypothetical protein CALK_2386 [Chitinivibrio alkaliphilus ACht1]|uniref:Uncharacterized protein n=1 Tax=Chitinivibrio alkaliphilus ACht1 TaxID=1313304 RepID=U7D6R7_9BACT|nr:hypothetical protein CALK_2386 [Chitinivibrio alkaliphilus ACht1]
MQANDSEIKSGRHPKSYFLGVHKEGNQYRGQILYLPFHFYEPGKEDDYLKAYDDMNSFLMNSGKMQEVQ